MMSTTGNQMAALSVLTTEYRQLVEQGQQLVAAVGRSATADRSAGQGVARIHLHEVMHLDRLFALSEDAVGTWAPGEPASPLVGRKRTCRRLDGQLQPPERPVHRAFYPI